MRSKTSKSFKAKLGFARAQLNSFVFSGLILTVIMVGLTFAIGSNPLFGYRVRDISYTDSNSVQFGLIISIAAFVFAGFTLKPFMAKNESDTFLSLPISKFSLLYIQVIFGLIATIFSCVLSFAVLFPSLNLAKFENDGTYLTAIISMLLEIILPMCVFYLLCVVLIISTKNFFASFLSFGVFLSFSFFCGKIILDSVGHNALGVNYYDITMSNQAFYYNSGIFLPTKLFFIFIKTIFNVESVDIDFRIITAIINLVLLAVLFILFYISTKKISLGDLGKPFSVKPTLKYLPVLIVSFLPTFLYLLVSRTLSIIIFAVCALTFFVLIKLLFKIKLKQLFKFSPALLAFVLPLLIVLCNQPYTEQITFEVPNENQVKAVYFNPIYPMSTADIIDQDIFNNSTYKTLNNFGRSRYKFESKESIKSVINLHSSIANNLKSNNILNTNSFATADGITISESSDLSFIYDDYQTYIDENTTVNESWGIYDQQDLSLDYFAYFDSFQTIEVEAEHSLPIYSTSETNLEMEEYPKYKAAFYYELNDGRWFFRTYNFIPITWIKDRMIDVLTSPEAMKAQNNQDQNQWDDYSDDYTGYDDYKGQPFKKKEEIIESTKDNNLKIYNSKYKLLKNIKSFDTLELQKAMLLDDLKTINSRKTVYSISIDGINYDVPTSSLNVIKILEKIIGKSGDN